MPNRFGDQSADTTPAVPPTAAVNRFGDSVNRFGDLPEVQSLPPSSPLPMIKSKALVDESPAPSLGSQLGTAASGFGSEMLHNLNPANLLSGIKQLLTHPVDTLWTPQMKALREKAGQQFNEGNYLDSSINAIGGSVPWVGPAYATGLETTDPETAGKSLADIASLKAVPYAYGKVPAMAKTAYSVGKVAAPAAAGYALGHYFGPVGGDIGAALGMSASSPARALAKSVLSKWIGKDEVPPTTATVPDIQPVNSGGKGTGGGNADLLNPGHSTVTGVDQAVHNKVQNIGQYFAKKGFTGEQVAGLDPGILRQHLDAALEHGKANNLPTPKTGYKGLEGDSLKRVQDFLDSRTKNPSQPQQAQHNSISPIIDTQIPAAIKSLEPSWRDSVPVSMDRLQSQFPNVSRPELEAAINRLRGARQVYASMSDEGNGGISGVSIHPSQIK